MKQIEDKILSKKGNNFQGGKKNHCRLLNSKKIKKK